MKWTSGRWSRGGSQVHIFRQTTFVWLQSTVGISQPNAHLGPVDYSNMTGLIDWLNILLDNKMQSSTGYILALGPKGKHRLKIQRSCFQSGPRTRKHDMTNSTIIKNNKQKQSSINELCLYEGQYTGMIRDNKNK